MNDATHFDPQRIEIMLLGVEMERSRIYKLLTNWNYNGLITPEQADRLVVALQVLPPEPLDYNENCATCNEDPNAFAHGEHTFTCEFCGNGLATERITTKNDNTEWWCEDCRAKHDFQ